MAVALPLTPELVLVAPPEEAAHARSLLPDPVPPGVAPVERFLSTDEESGSGAGRVALVVYSGVLLTAVAFVLVAMIVHELRFVAGL